MLFHIIEERKFDRDGNPVPPPDFYVVDEAGKKVSDRCATIEEAKQKLLEIEANYKLEAEKSCKKDAGLGR